MAVIDVDSHYDVAVAPEDHPFKHLRDEIPSSIQYIAQAVSGDLLSCTPSVDAPPIEVLGTMLNAKNASSTRYATFEAAGPAEFDSLTVGERVAWMDSVGIDFGLVNPGSIGIMACLFLEQHRPDIFRRYNDFMAEYLSGHLDRMAPVALLDWRDMDGALTEMSRMRSKGSRAFWVRAEPYHGVAPGHPDWDRVWSAATDLGMLAILHVGNTPPAFGAGWANAGWNQPGGTGVGGFFRYANSMRHQAAEMMLGGMIYAGVFGRHPNLTVVTEELGIGWLPYFVDRCRSLSGAGPWPFEQTPAEMARSNVRSSPLLGLGDPPPFQGALAGVAEMMVFSSDFPHGEGNADPINLLEDAMSPLGDHQRAQFLGGNIADCFARMGDPLI